MSKQKILNVMAEEMMQEMGDDTLDMLEEVNMILLDIPPPQWKKALKNVAKVYGLETPRCLS